jgi:hypothetical protein
MTWEEDQEWEGNWWGDCLNTWGEEQKQRHYAKCMGLVELSNSQFSFYYDLKGRSILDIGGGPVSLLLKCVNVKSGMVVDPLSYPDWIAERYRHAGITYAQATGEKVTITGFDEVWIYNVLQHVKDPVKIIENAKRAGKIIRLFEWLEIGVAPGHPHNLLEDEMNEWLGGFGGVKTNGGGKEYYGVFLGDDYQESE